MEQQIQNSIISQNQLSNEIIITIGQGVNFEMVLVQAGTFLMGSPSNENGRDNDEHQHQVTLTYDYFIGKYEVTQEQWKAVMGNNPSNFEGDNLPVEQVSWNDCQEFISKLNNLLEQSAEFRAQSKGMKFRLPTEAEWEYAARGGHQSKGYMYSGSNNINEVAWYIGNSSSKTQTVGSKKANELGIYDMSGNLWEWCEDCYGDYPEGSVTNPKGAASGRNRMLRGGCWNRNADDCRSAYRDEDCPSRRWKRGGFRLVLSVKHEY